MEKMGFSRIFGRMNEAEAREYTTKLEDAMRQLQRDGKDELAWAVYFALEVCRRDRDAVFDAYRVR